MRTEPSDPSTSLSPPWLPEGHTLSLALRSPSSMVALKILLGTECLIHSEPLQLEIRQAYSVKDKVAYNMTNSRWIWMTCDSGCLSRILNYGEQWLSETITNSSEPRPK
jgi:hypothetical protein